MVRAATAVFGITCMVLSLMLLLRIGFLGFAIGGWTGLKGYEQAIVQARRTAKTAELELVFLQVVGGTSAFLIFRRKRGLAWSPLFIVGFSSLTLVLFWLYIAVLTVAR